MSSPAVSSPPGAHEDVDDGIEDAAPGTVRENLSKEQAAESAQLEKVTDFAEEQEMDTSKAQAALHNLTAADHAETQRAAELAAVSVKQDDIDVLAKEFEISADEAEHKLREARGDLKAAIQKLL